MELTSVLGPKTGTVADGFILRRGHIDFRQILRLRDVGRLPEPVFLRDDAALWLLGDLRVHDELLFLAPLSERFIHDGIALLPRLLVLKANQQSVDCWG